MFGGLFDHSRMAKRAPAGRPILRLREWVFRTASKQNALAKHVRVGESYISQLVKGSKDGPEIDKLFAISDFFQVPIEALFRPPPKSDEALERMRALWRLQNDIRELDGE